jgi:hypothetical protein
MFVTFFSLELCLVVLQTMGFQDIAGDRRFVRHIKFTTEKGEVVAVQLVYDYCEAGLDVTKA